MTTGGAVVPMVILVGHPKAFVRSNLLVEIVVVGLRQRREEMLAHVLRVALGRMTMHRRRVKIVFVALYQIRVASGCLNYYSTYCTFLKTSHAWKFSNQATVYSSTLCPLFYFLSLHFLFI